MAKIISKGGEVEVSGPIEDVLNKAYKLSLEDRLPVCVKTDKFVLHVEGPPYADNGQKVIYGWLRDHDREKLAELEEVGKKVFPEFHSWISKKGVRVEYEPNTKTDLLTIGDVILYTGMLAMGFKGRWSERPKKSKYGWNVDDLAFLKYDDNPDNQEIVGLPAVVTKVVTTGSPNWLEVVHNGKAYSVRGDDCKKGK